MKLGESRSICIPRIVLRTLLFLIGLFTVSLWTCQSRAYGNSYEYQKYMEKSFIPDGAVELVNHDLGKSSPLYIKYYGAYSQVIGGELINDDTWLSYEASSENDLNGIRLDITSFLKEGSSGNTFGASMQIRAEDWVKEENRENKSLMFFEICDAQGNVKQKVLLDSVKPNKDNSNMTTEEAKIGANWALELLKGESVLNFESTDKIYLCVTQKNTKQGFDKVYVWYYEDADEVLPEATISKPSMNVEGDALTFMVENLSGVDKEYSFLIQSLDGDKVSSQRLYKMTVPTGTDRTQFTIPASKGEKITLTDESGDYIVKDYEISDNIWVGTWGSAQLTPGEDTMPPSPGLAGNTYRQIVRVSTGGSVVRLLFSNEFGSTPLEINSTYIAKVITYGNSAIDPSSNTQVTFNGGDTKVVIPAGKTVTSDEIYFTFAPLDFVAVTTLFGEVPATITSHTASRSNNFLIAGDHVKDEVFTGASTTTSWYFLSDMDVLSPVGSFAVVCFGDSITDGYGVEINKIQRWSDILAERLQANPETQHISVINKGIGGNALGGGNGPAGFRRFTRDVIQPSGVKAVIMLLGVNDIGYANMDITPNMIHQYKSMIETAHNNGIKVYAGLITPFEGNAYYSDLHEQIRIQFNEWACSEESGFDGVIDFAGAIADPERPSKMLAQYSNDGLHPSAAGYAKMGESIDLSIFREIK